MKLSALTVCVGYAEILSRSLERWRDGADALLVVTSTTDPETVALCEATRVPVLLTDDFYANGDWFNKAAGMNRGIESGLLPWEDWALFFDADILPPPDWRARVETADPVAGNLYGVPRYSEAGDLLQETAMPGYFHLFHTRDPHVGRPVVDDTTLYLGFARGFLGFDLAFRDQWPAANARQIPGLQVTHFGARGAGYRKYLLHRAQRWYEWKLGRPWGAPSPAPI